MKKTFILIAIVSLGCTQKLYIYKGSKTRCSATITSIKDPTKEFELDNLCPRLGPSKQVKWQVGDTIALRGPSNWAHNKSKHN